MIDQPWKKQGPKPKRYPYKGRMLTIAELAEISGWTISAIYKRIESGLPIEQAADKASVKRPPPKSASLVLSYRGEDRTLSEWAEVEWVRQRGITKSDIYARIYQLGWTKEQAFGDEPRRRPNQRLITVQTPDGPVEKTLKEWSDHLGIPQSTISRRLSRGWTKEQAMGYEPSPSELRDAEQAESDDDVNG